MVRIGQAEAGAQSKNLLGQFVTTNPRRCISSMQPILMCTLPRDFGWLLKDDIDATVISTPLAV